MAGCWGHGWPATASGRPWQSSPLAAEPELALSTHPLSQKPTALLQSSPNPNYTDSAGPGSTEKPFGGNPKPVSSYSENLPPPDRRKDHKLSIFQLTFPLHRGGTDQGLAAPQLFLPSDFRNCRPVLVTGHHSQLKSIHRNHKESKPQYTAAHGHSHHYTGHMDPNYRASFQGPWTAQGIRRDMRPIAANSLCLSEEDTKFRLPVSILQRASKLNVPVVCGRPSPE